MGARATSWALALGACAVALVGLPVTAAAAPPNTTITGGPTAPSFDRRPSFSFTSAAGATFECRLDTAGWVPCTTPYRVPRQPGGAHLFRVRASLGGETDPTPSGRYFEVEDAVPVGAPGITPEVPQLYRPVRFAAAGFDRNGDPLAFSWSFQGGPAVPGAQLTKRFISIGPHTGRMFVVDSSGQSSSSQFDFDVVARSGACANSRAGTPAGDNFHGTRAGDRLSGAGGNDRLAGGRGRDCLSGGAGRDRLFGGAGGDRLDGGGGGDRLNGGSGHDRIRGGAGDDLIKVRGGRRDSVDCGPGIDRVVADLGDRLSGNCEVFQKL
jgi:hemolysin type calcium-binding protein